MGDEKGAGARPWSLLNLLEPDGRCWCLFTPWHPDDLNAELKRNPEYPLFRRAVGDKLEPVWPEKWPRARLEERRREVGNLSFARGYRLVHIPELLRGPENPAAATLPAWPPGPCLRTRGPVGSNYSGVARSAVGFRAQGCWGVVLPARLAWAR